MRGRGVRSPALCNFGLPKRQEEFLVTCQDVRNKILMMMRVLAVIFKNLGGWGGPCEENLFEKNYGKVMPSLKMLATVRKKSCGSCLNVNLQPGSSIYFDCIGTHNMLPSFVRKQESN